MVRRDFFSRIATLGFAVLAQGDQAIGSERILFADAGAAKDLPTGSFRELGRVANGIYLACPDETVRALALKRLPAFLYFDRRSYELAVANLTPVQVLEVIRKREERAPEAMSFAMDWLSGREKAALEGALQCANAEKAVDSALTLLQELAGLVRYDQTTAKGMAATVLEGESLLNSALSSALNLDVFEANERSLLATHRERRKLWTKELAQLAVALGAREFAQAIPYAEISRGIFLHPASASVEQVLSNGGEPFVRWRDGLLFVSTERRFDTLRAQNRTVEILYADSGEFYESARSLTTAQIHRDVESRRRRSKADISRDYLGQIDRLHLHQILMTRELCKRTTTTEECTRNGIAALVREETVMLGRSLAHTHTFSAAHGLDALAPQPLLLRSNSAFDTDLSLFSAIANRYSPFLVPALTRTRKLKAAVPTAPSR